MQETPSLSRISPSNEFPGGADVADDLTGQRTTL